MSGFFDEGKSKRAKHDAEVFGLSMAIPTLFADGILFGKYGKDMSGPKLHNIPIALAVIAAICTALILGAVAVSKYHSHQIAKNATVATEQSDGNTGLPAPTKGGQSDIGE